jgi:ABC-type branched-subunit amino acid transport system ATPase component/ABC-type branched-subunit amino acid transport system permease subunit
MTWLTWLSWRGRLTRRGLLVMVLVLVAVVALAVLPGYTGQYGLLVAFEIVQLAALAQAWSLMAGYGGIVSLAVAAFVGVGSYATAEVSAKAGLGLYPSVLAGGLVAVVFALIVAVPMLRFRGLYFTIGSLVLAEALGIFMSNFGGFGGNMGVTLTGTAPSPQTIYLLSFVVAVLATGIVAGLVRSRLGLGLRAIRDDEDVAERVGVLTFRTKLTVFLIASFVMGLVGGIQAQWTGYIEPTGAFALDWTVETVNAAIIGGVGTIVGPLLGSGISVGLSQRLANYPTIHLIILGALLIVVIRLAPNGLWGAACQLARAGQRRFLGRRGGAGEGEVPASAAAPAAVAPAAVAGSAAAVVRPAGAPAAGGPAAGGAAALLRAVGVAKVYGGVRAVDGVDVELRPGEVLGMIGPNGAGKSTLIGLLSGAISGEGTVELFGEDVTGAGAQQRARRGIGRTHQVPRPFGQMTVMENLLVAHLHGAKGTGRAARAECERILARCGLAEFAEVRASDLGLLRLKRLELARALAVKPRILLLDEIGAGLVESELRELISLIRELRQEVAAILIVEHVIDVIRECCDRLIVIDGGQLLVSGDPDEVLRDPQVAAVYLGTSGGQDVPPAASRTRGSGSGGQRTLLEVKGVAARYGAFRALHDVSFSVAEGEVLALLGANGAGKTTTARSISGMLPVSAGEIWFDGQRINGRKPHDIVRLGVAHCMEGRKIFGDLTVEENLLLGARAAGSSKERARRLDAVYEVFGALRERRGNSGFGLSGGQQQMLAIGRALMAEPRLIIFDEISLGLAPITVDRLYHTLTEINGRGVAMIVIEQNVARGLALADHVAVLEKGRVALTGEPADMRADDRLLSLYVGEARGAAPAVPVAPAPAPAEAQPAQAPPGAD